MAESNGGRRACLIVRVQSHVCALPLAHVIETMRQLPIEPLAGAPSFVRGVSIVRGTATPVVDLAGALGAVPCNGERFVTVRVEGRQVALSVDSVLGVREIDLSAVAVLPPLLQGVSKNLIETIGTLDGQFLTVLRSAWELPEELWHALTFQEAVS